MNTNHQRIGIALDLLAAGLFPFFEQSLRAVYGERWEETARASCRSQASLQPGAFHWDAQAILTVMWDTWNPVFRKSLGLIERSLVSELREFRNRWAHQSSMTEDDGYRVLDSVQRLLTACGADGTAAEVEEQKLDLLREKLGRRVNEELARVRFNRARLVDTGLYVLCAIAITTMMVLMWGDRHPMSAGFVIGFTLFVFAYLIYRRFQASTARVWRTRMRSMREGDLQRELPLLQSCPAYDNCRRSKSRGPPSSCRRRAFPGSCVAVHRLDARPSKDLTF